MKVNLVLFKKDGSQKVIPLTTRVAVIGRRHSCDLCIPLMSVSKRHCQLYHDNGALKVRDLGSRNGTILNGKPVDEAVIHAGDCIKIGPLGFLFQIDGQPEKVALPPWFNQEAARQDVKAEETAQETADEQFGDAVELEDSDLLLDDSDILLDDLESLEDSA
ncbi:MAG: FHA domain-containing protein [Planctomycetota bacterium]|jgi:pSer/pThr/pTyr-binding forkhead associated (FHA) protein